MKLLHSTGFALLSASHQVMAGILDLMADMKNQSESAQQPNPHARNFGHAVQINSESKWDTLKADYGCWCQFGDPDNLMYVGTGKGEPKDAFDAECKLLHDNYACLVVEESSCDPYRVIYSRPGGDWTSSWLATLMDPLTTADTIEQRCNEANAPLCERSACIIESTFLQKWWQLYDSNDINVAQYGQGNFDATSQCNMGNNFQSWTSNRGSKRCCGEYSSYKKIYFTGTKGCCSGNIYNHQTRKCCPGGSIRDMNDAC